ncbi:hypothetical protein O163_10040 [Caldanaerobacter subterraneus subsp. yonseiensis KB-1]|uniref:Uncharacterized protein n=1 Tax=Caldanaerobacter subterraneus subsp. yonseiensis KB-1 TaxID=1388761 RepID=U5CF15_CALSX|nr:hypothetical protein [Caldanaerobacter subterraneus]ERM91505.1 hypothetical protein O163_10040 [Caldanaerobacter subterraneus subsp. yonseiensis KB-1]
MNQQCSKVNTFTILRDYKLWKKNYNFSASSFTSLHQKFYIKTMYLLFIFSLLIFILELAAVKCKSSIPLIMLLILNVSLLVFYRWFKKFNIYSKENDKKIIKNQVDKVAFSIKNKHKKYKKLSEMMFKSKIYKKSLELKLHDYSYANYINLLLGFLGGLFLKSNDINFTLFLIIFFFAIITAIYFYIEISLYSITYEIEMHDYKISYIEYLLTFL